VYTITSSSFLFIITLGVDGKPIPTRGELEYAALELADDRFCKLVHLPTAIILVHQGGRADANDACIYSVFPTCRVMIEAISIGCAVYKEEAIRSLLLVKAAVISTKTTKDGVIDIVSQDIAEIADVVLPWGCCKAGALTMRPV
jgi:hypothetical protein